MSLLVLFQGGVSGPAAPAPPAPTLALATAMAQGRTAILPEPGANRIQADATGGILGPSGTGSID